MSRVVKRASPQSVKPARSHRDLPLPQFIRPQLSQLVAKPPSGPQWVHEIKLDGYRMAARVDNGRVQLLTRTGLDWTAKYPGAIAAAREPQRKDSLHRRRTLPRRRRWIAELRSYPGRDGRRERSKARLLRFRSPASRWPGCFPAAADRAQNAPRTPHRWQARPSIQWPRYRRRRTHPEARRQARLRNGIMFAQINRNRTF
jgi:hypothetical protein